MRPTTEHPTFYLCPTCFEAHENMPDTHAHPMVQIPPILLGDDLRKPPVDGTGRMQSRAPRWFLQIRNARWRVVDWSERGGGS